MRIVIIPAFNEATAIGDVIRGVLPFADKVVVIDDGSSDQTGDIAQNAGAIVIRHALNRGLGAALGTGIAAAKQMGAQAVITFDADGQHSPEDIPRMLEPIEKGNADAVIGARVKDRSNMPVLRRIFNWVGNALTYVLFGLWVQDSQSGLRAFSKHAIDHMELRCDRMEVSSEFIKEIHRHTWRLVEVPIIPIYTEYSMSKGQSFSVGIKTAGRLILRRVIK